MFALKEKDFRFYDKWLGSQSDRHRQTDRQTDRQTETLFHDNRFLLTLACKWVNPRLTNI